MKYDLELIREILMAVEEYEPDRLNDIQPLEPNQFSGTPPQNRYHVETLIEDGYLRQSSHPGLLSGTLYVDGMTAAGRDFLEAIRDKTVLEATKKRAGKLASWTIGTVAEIAKQEIKNRLGIGIL